MNSAFYLFALLALTWSAPIPELEEEFNLPGASKQETHTDKFVRSDANRNKELTFDEFLHMELAYVEAKKEEFEMLDKDHNGKISQDEYEEHFHGENSRSAALRAEYFGKVFEEFDEDFDMALSPEEVEHILAERFLVNPRENFPKIFYSFDSDHSGGLDLSEYMKFDAKFPFEETDAIKSNEKKQEKLPGQKPKKSRKTDKPSHSNESSEDHKESENKREGDSKKTTNKKQKAPKVVRVESGTDEDEAAIRAVQQQARFAAVA